MAKPVSPLLGYNNNIRHKNRVFHIQTEDSGIKHPHIITHLFMDGGRILKTIKKSYAEHVGVDGMAEIVRQMMKEQHKSMFIALRDGQFDHLVDGGAPKAEAPAVSQAAPTTDRDPARAEVKAPEAPPSPEPAKPAAAEVVPPVAAAAAGAPTVELAPVASQAPTTARDADPPPPAAPPRSSKLIVVAEAAEDPPVTIPQPERAGAHPLAIDLEALERAAQAGGEAPVFQASADLPPPARPHVEKTSSAYRALEAQTEVPLERTPRRSVPPPASLPGGAKRPQVRQVAPQGARQGERPPSTPAAAQRSAPPSAASPMRRTSSGRYAPARPASIFSRQKPREGAVFDEGVVNDKTLDEVILSYLAEDLDGPPRKK